MWDGKSGHPLFATCWPLEREKGGGMQKGREGSRRKRRAPELILPVGLEEKKKKIRGGGERVGGYLTRGKIVKTCDGLTTLAAWGGVGKNTIIYWLPMEKIHLPGGGKKVPIPMGRGKDLGQRNGQQKKN